RSEAARLRELLAALRRRRQGAGQGLMSVARFAVTRRADGRSGARPPTVAWALLLPLALLGLWALSAQRGWLPVQILPAPSEAVGALWELAKSGDLLRDTSISLLRVVE